uniref:Gag-Pol polyprotein n=1 Tax=Tanacetum cinerariifolium TaxID=118510 RepID=A0A6L2JFR2_TANCI|nr:Gag-Pol polyprotein [Tanacetum cinerariifolium]
MMTNLSEDIQCAGFDTRPPMLDRTDFESWQQRIRLYCLGKDNGVNILKSIDEGPFKLGKLRETLAEGALHLGPEQDRVFDDLTPEENEMFKDDIHATNILLQGLPKDIYTLINHYTNGKDIWDNVKMLLEDYELTKDERESQLYDDFDTSVKTKEKPFTNTMSVQNGKAVVQNVQGRQNRGQGNYARGAVATGNGVIQNKAGNANAGQSKQENEVVLDEEQLSFITGGQSNTFDDDDVDESSVQDLTMFMENLSLADPIYDEAGPLYDSDILSEVQDHDNYIDSVEDTLELAETTRMKMLEKSKSTLWVDSKIKIAPLDYSKENYLATFNPHRQLTLEQIFWSEEVHKHLTKVLKPNTALTVYPPNTPAKLVPRVLPTKSQVKINIYTLMQLFSEFEKTCKKKITPTGITEGEMGFEQTKECYLTEPVKEKSTKHVPSTKANKGKVLKVQKGKRSDRLVDEEDEESQPAPEPQIEDDEYNLRRVTNEASTRPSAQPQDDTSVNVVHDTSSPTDAETVIRKILIVRVILKFLMLMKNEVGSDPCNILESRPPPDEDQAGSNPGQSHVALVGPNPKPIHEDFVATVYTKVHKSLKHTTKEHVFLENLPSSSGTLSSIKNLDDAFTFSDQFNDDKPTKEEPGKANVESEVESMVTVPIHQASSLAPLLSTPIIDLTTHKPLSPPIQEPVFTATIPTTTTTTTTLLPLPPLQQQSTTNPALVARVTVLEQICANFEKKNKVQDQTTQALSSRIFTLANHDLYLKINIYINETVKEAPEHTTLYEALEASMDCENREEFVEATTKSHKRRRDDQDPPSPPPKDLDQNNKKRHDSDASASKQSQAPTSSAWKTSNIREAPSSSSKQKTVTQYEQPVDDVSIPDDAHISDSEDTSAAHLPKIKTKPDWLKPLREEERLKTPEPDWAIPPNDLSETENNWANAIANAPFQKNNISLQFQMEECHLLLTDQIDLVNPKGNRAVPDVSKPLPLGGPPGQVTIQPHYFFNKDLEYLVSGDKDRRNTLSISKLKAAYYPDFGLEELVPSLWIESEREHDISAAYDISNWWFKRKEFYITRHSALSDRHAVRSHMCILSVVHLFNVVNLWIRNVVIKKRVEDLQLRIESYQTKLNLTQPSWDASGFLFKEDYTIVHKPRGVIYRDRNNQKKMTRESAVHKFSDGMLTKILEKLDHMVKDFVLFKFNPGIENIIWSEDDKRRSKNL